MNWVNVLKEMRAADWMVAVHNDYRQDGKPMTFWLFTHPSGEYVKGEGETDEQAVMICAYDAWLENLFPYDPHKPPA